MKAAFVADKDRSTQSQLQGILAKRRIEMFTKNDIKTRFEEQQCGAFQGIDIITDKVTGVQLFISNQRYWGGINSLIDGDGKPVFIKNRNR